MIGPANKLLNQLSYDISNVIYPSDVVLYIAL